MTQGVAAHAFVAATGLRPRTLAGLRDPAGARPTVVGYGVPGAENRRRDVVDALVGGPAPVN
ncbi:hypothetical protein [Streptomyces sp. NPDC060035]|uniref:hypothetical protein n=1 Tax=Streptomyces sp. NPDC060035 TaxID=3347044 RepID=UPI003684AF30